MGYWHIHLIYSCMHTVVVPDVSISNKTKSNSGEKEVDPTGTLSFYSLLCFVVQQTALRMAIRLVVVVVYVVFVPRLHKMMTLVKLIFLPVG